MIKKKFAIPLFIICLIFSNLPFSHADNISFKAFVDKDKAEIGDGIELHFQFSGTSQMPAPEMPVIENFQVRYLGPSTRLSIVNGITEQSITHRYLLVPLKDGVFHLGPFTITYKGIAYTSQAILLSITKGGTSQKISSSYAQPSENLDDRVFLTLETDKSQVFLNEAIPATITLYTRGIRVQVDQYPEFSTPGFTVGAFEQHQQFRQTYNDMVYDVIQFKTKVYAAQTGDFMIGPARLKCNLIVRKPGGAGHRNYEGFFDQDFFESFFGGHESVPMDLKSPVLPLTVKPFPDSNRPSDFNGAVGDFIFTASASPLEVNIGDPITVKMTIKGDGNFNNVSYPHMTSTDGFKTYEAQIKQDENEKTFEQVILPQKKDIQEVPSFSFSFFNPRLNKYETLHKGPFPIKVNATGKEQEPVFIETSKRPIGEPEQEQEENLGKGIVFIKTSLGNFKKEGVYLYQSIVFWLFQGFVLLVFMIIIVWVHKNERLRNDVVYARSLQAPKKARKCLSEAQKFLKKGQIKDFYDTIFKLLRGYLGDKFQLSSGAITWKIIEDVLKNKNISPEELKKIERLFCDCDMIRYAPAIFDEQKMKQSFSDLQSCLMYLEKTKL